MDSIKVMFDPETGDSIIDAHDKYGRHIKGSDKFTENLGKALGEIEDRHKGTHVHVVNNETVKA